MAIYFYEGFWTNLLWWFFGMLCAAPFGLLFYYIVNRFLQVREKWWMRLYIIVTGLACSGNVIFIGDAFNILFFLPFFGCALWFCTKGSRSARLSMIFILYPLTMAFNAVMDNLLTFFPGGRIEYSAIQVLCRLAFWATLSMLARTFIRETAGNGRPMLSPKLWLLLDLLALTPAAAVLVLVIYPSRNAMSDYSVWLFRVAAMYTLPFVVLSSIGLLCAVAVLSRHEALRRAETLWELRSIYYQNLEQEQTQVRRLRHDMANHLQALSGLMEEPDKARAYLDSLVNMPGLTVSRRFCDNPTVNTVLAGKTALMEEKGIKGDIAVALPRELPLSDTDLCALFANALDNAIEACERLENMDERVIWVRARADKGLLMVQVTNRTGGAAPATLETTKADKASHGYGLAILHEIAVRANGTCAVEQRPGVFELIVTAPL